jgi:hypothetical protein
VLNVSSNKIQGSLPSNWAFPQGLAGLSLSFNQLSGSMPSSWSIPALQIAELNNNQLTGNALAKRHLWYTSVDRESP